MSSLRPLVVLSLLIALVGPNASAQNNQPFDLQAYEAYLSAHADMNSAQLLAMHSAGTFAQRSPVMPGRSTTFRSSIPVSFTQYERSFLSDHGFVVTDRLRYHRSETRSSKSIIVICRCSCLPMRYCMRSTCPTIAILREAETAC